MLEEPMVSFTAHDRCDRCMAQAYVQVEKKGFSHLLFCLHHTREFADALLDDGWTLRSGEEAETLYENESETWHITT